jgi:hypothetical protein
MAESYQCPFTEDGRGMSTRYIGDNGFYTYFQGEAQMMIYRDYDGSMECTNEYGNRIFAQLPHACRLDAGGGRITSPGVCFYDGSPTNDCTVVCN